MINPTRYIFVSSAYRGNKEENIKKVKEYCREIVKGGMVPIAPHLYFPQFLDDNNEDEREEGIMCGKELMLMCDKLYAYGAVTEGMKDEIEFALNHGIEVVFK